MAKNKMRMPSSEGGLVRYYDEEYKSKIMLKPEHVLVLCGILAAGLIFVRLF